jgi:capsular polysaccharide biosynthesis protein
LLNFNRYEISVLRPSRLIKREPPNNYREEDKALFEEHMQYRTLDSKLYQIPNGYITGNGVIYSSFFSVLTDSLVMKEQKKYHQTNSLIKHALLGKKKVLKGNRYLSVVDEWSVGHFHWFCDVVPKLVCLGARTSDYILLLPNHPYIHRMGIPSILHMGVQFKDIQFIEEGSFYKVQDLSFVSRVSKSGQMDDELMAKIKAHFTANTTEAKRKLYISRKQAKVRKVLNEEMVEGVLKENGFEIIESDVFSLSEHIALFGTAQSLVSIHGAGLTNSLFMKKGTAMSELIINKPSDNRCYYQLATSTGMQYFYHCGEPDSERPLEGNGCNITLDRKKFENFLQTLA